MNINRRTRNFVHKDGVAPDIDAAGSADFFGASPNHDALRRYRGLT